VYAQGGLGYQVVYEQEEVEVPNCVCAEGGGVGVPSCAVGGRGKPRCVCAGGGR